MSTEANKALVSRFYEEIDKGNLEAMDELARKITLSTIRLLSQSKTLRGATRG